MLNKVGRREEATEWFVKAVAAQQGNIAAWHAYAYHLLTRYMNEQSLESYPSHTLALLPFFCIK